MIFVLSLTGGIRFQTLCMDAKIRAFFAAAMRGGEVTGRNSATGSPRLSITITPPSAASRTNFDVLMCNSRTDVVLICYIVAPGLRQSRRLFRTIQYSSRGLHLDSKILLSASFPNRPEATDRTTSTSSSSPKVVSQLFISRNVMAAFAPTRLLPSMNAWFWQR